MLNTRDIANLIMRVSNAVYTDMGVHVTVIVHRGTEQPGVCSTEPNTRKLALWLTAIAEAMPGADTRAHRVDESKD